jgi:hypothetical protein
MFKAKAKVVVLQRLRFSILALLGASPLTQAKTLVALCCGDIC